MDFVMDFVIIAALMLLVIYSPLWAIRGMGYLIQKFKFGYSFKEVHEYHKEQDRLEALSKDDM